MRVGAQSRSIHDRRFLVKLPVNFGVQNIKNIGFTGDISPGGLFIKSARVFPTGSDLKIEMTSENGEIVRLIGFVQWSKQVAPNLVWSVKDAGMGIKIRKFVCGKEHYFKMLTQKRVGMS
ncbi:MAG: pilus assembly protein PilZ [Desulfuromonas sp.]|nr:MAG: pilus assembly protein PilZ [Desulfuromonas sp.]